MPPFVSILFPSIDPIAIAAGPLVIRWYALAYVAGILIGWWYLGKLNHRKPHPLNQKAYDDFIVWAILGIMLGGRLGYVLFYNPVYYFAHPAEILAIWRGGMSFHGGLIGAIISAWIMCKRNELEFLRVMDVISCIAPIGLFFGRIANFVNGELYGRIADESLPWGVIFPSDPFSRHPSQLYEAALEGLLLFIILSLLFYKTNLRLKPGILSGIFLSGYALFRGGVEFFREPDAHIGFILPHITMGHILCLPMLLVGLFLIIRAQHHARNAD